MIKITPEQLNLTIQELKVLFVKEKVGGYIHDTLGCDFYISMEGLKKINRRVDVLQR